jgi:RsiW-degrading membrane proteinase PrsW (M82 family)
MAVYKLLTPPDEVEVYPYRRVWRSVIIEMGALGTVTAGVFVAFALVGVQLPAFLTSVFNIVLLALPVVLWLLFSVLAERFVPQPRARQIAVFVITALAANAFALPFINGVLQPERWLPLGGAVSRIIGYAFTVGIVQEVTKYAVVRFTTWPDLFRTRLDGVAYSVASALGYAFVLNLNFLLSQPTLAPDVFVVQMFNNVAINVAASLIVSYGLAEVRFDQPTPFLMTIMVALAALLNGAAIPLRSGLTNAGFALEGSLPKPILSFGFSAGVLLVIAVIAAFLFANAERQAREVAASREV